MNRWDHGAFWRHFALVALFLLLGIALWRWRGLLWILFQDRERVQAWAGGLGAWGPLAMIGLNVAQVLLAPVPGQFVGLINGYLYGVALGVLYSMIGLVLGTALAMGVGRWLGRPLVEKLVPVEQLDHWDGIAGRQGPWFFFLVFLLPFVPDDISSFLIGLSPLPIPHMLVLTTLGRLPGVVVSCWIGAHATALPWWAWGPLVGAAAGLAWGFWRYHERLEAAVVRLIKRLMPSQVL